MVKKTLRIRHRGIPLGYFYQKLQNIFRKLEKKIFKNAGTEFNIKSTKQLAEVLFVKMEISTDAIKKTKTGISTAADELEKLKTENGEQ